ncbi:hypothetical protein HMSSN139_51600 [Paenibacillus sp. HMSSN-139]|nr:hypothetical protein HMSSN139_51600 [Paenibacillus sp. HMSSN-139]
MMDWLELLLGFLIANLLGYGGGPSSIPLMYEEIVPHYHWLSDAEFSNMLALGNALPGPIATKSPLTSALRWEAGVDLGWRCWPPCCPRRPASFCCSACSPNTGSPTSSKV